MPENTNKITRLVFSGGGVKGTVYPGAYAALKETGVFDDVKEIAGSSAGAFTAALLAVGMPTSEFHSESTKINFADLLGDLTNNSWFTKDGKPMYDYLHKAIKRLVLTFLSNETLDESHDCWALLQALKQTDTDYGPTFSDLDLLVRLWPNRFKRLTITAVKEDGGDLKIFNCHDTPNIEIALACRASGSLPVFLTPVEIEGVNYVDGGLHENIPTESFDLNPATKTYKKNKRPKETLVFAFVDGNQNEKKTIYKQIVEFFFGGSSIFNALYGSRKDEYDNLELFKTLLDLVETELNRKRLDSENTPIETLIDEAVNTIEENYKTYNWSWIMHAFTVIVSSIIAVWTYICSFFIVPTPEDSKKESNEWTTYLNIIRDSLKEAVSRIAANNTETSEHASVICEHARSSMSNNLHIPGPNKPPTLFDAQFVEFHAYNLVPKWLGSFKSDYHPGDKTEEGMQRIRSHYPLRTVGLGIGSLSPIDFDKATKHARFLSARGYMDTMNTILNLYLYHKDFDSNQYYSEIVEFFIDIFNEVLITSNKDPEQNPFLIQLAKQNLSIQSRYYLIKEEAESDLTSDLAFALTRAVEYRRDEISKEDIFKEVDERCLVNEISPVVSSANIVSGFFNRVQQSSSSSKQISTLISRIG